MAAALPEGGGGKDKVDEVCLKINQLVISANAPIKVNSFWNKFSAFYQVGPHDLPRPQDYGLAKRSEFLKLSKACVLYTGPDGHEYIKSLDKPKDTGKAKKKSSKAQSAETKNLEESILKGFTTITHKSEMAYRNPFFANNSPHCSQGARRGSHDNAQWNSPNMQRQNMGVQGINPVDIASMQHAHLMQAQWNQQRQAQQQIFFQPHQASTREPRTTNYKNISKDEINVAAEDCVDRLVEAKEYVSPERVEKLLLDHYKVESINNLGVRYLEHIKCINNLVRAQSRINAYIQAFIRIRAIATLHELQENLREYTEPKNQDFETLRLGPLVKQPLVYDYFKFPTDLEIPEIDTAAILDQLRAYLNENQLWTTKIEMEGFMSYLSTQFLVDSPFSLGIRIKSLPLATAVLKKSQRDMAQSSQASIRTFSTNTEESVSSAFRNFSTSVLVEEAGLCKMRMEYIKMSPSKLVEQVFSKLHVLVASISYLHSDQPHHKSHKNAHRNAELTKQFSNLIKNDSLYRELFRLAVCCSWEEVHTSLHALMGFASAVESGNSDGSASTSSDGGQVAHNKPRPRMGDVVAKIRTYLERCFVHGSLTLAHLTRIENKLLEDYEDFNSFYDLANMSFLALVTRDDSVKAYLEENGGASLGTATSRNDQSGGGYHAALHDLHDFILQTALTNPTQVPDLERALCWHYHVPEVKQLGHGSAASLQAGATKGQRHNKQQHVSFEVALCAKESQSTLGTTSERQVGLLGHQVRESALICLHNCPTLTDLAEWSHWDLVFKAELGELKDFIRKNGGVQSFIVPGTNKSVITNIVAMESKPGTLLKLMADTSNDMFASSVISGDVSATCGHLVSLIAANKGIQNTPMALLGNHLKTGLLKIQSGMHSDQDALNGGDAGATAAGQFVLQCLIALPFITCQAVASQVFIEPLSDVVGQTKSRELLIRCVTSDCERTRLQVLGLLLGIDHWSASFRQRLEPPTITHKAMVASIAATAAHRESELIELSSSEESDDESDILNTSDESDTDVKPPVVAVMPEVIDITSQEESMTIDSDSDEPSVAEIPSDNTKEEPTEKKEQPAEVSDEPAETVLTAPPSMDVATKACWYVVEDIRRTEFGINVTLSTEGQKLMKKQQDRLGRSLDRLSNDLYSKDTHFVLELIQNADDNKYPSDGSTVPSIKFVIEADHITVLNNEAGFEEQNIRAICDVGKSTKGKHKSGYIGQKGIGFKSVFRVTDCPEIHSHQYHFRFDLATGPMGYILPHWVPGNYDHQQCERWMTKIILPFKSDVVHSSKLRQLAARFQDVHPSLLLFLHRLRSITVINKIGEYKAKMERRDVGKGIIEIRHMMGSDRQITKTDRWLVAKKVLDASHISSQAKSGVEVESTEIALAFPLHEVDDSQTLAPKQPVFAFLPLRSYGFRFIIQGDFDVPSSREDVDRDSLWNQWLQSELHVLFVDALEAFKEQRNFSAVEAVCLFIKFIPLEDEILDFFRPVATQILQRLRSEPCLPADALPGRVAVWRLPSQLILTTDSLLRDIVTPDLLQSQLGLAYLHRDVAARINPSLLSGLGVQVVSTSHLIEIGRAISQLIPQATADEKMQWVQRLSKWFTALFRSLDEFDVDKRVMAQIEALPLVPLSNGSITCIKDNAIFFPLGSDESDDANQDMLVYLEKDLNTVDAALFTPLDEVARPQATRLLEMLGVRRLLPADIINHHILPALRAPNIMAKPPGLLMAYLVYMKEELDRQPNLVSMAELKEVALVQTNQGLKRPSKDNIHFTPEYGNKLNLTQELPGYEWLLIDPVYLIRSETNVEKRTWHTFLMALGVHDLIAVTEQSVTLTRQDMVQSKWSEHASALPPSEHEAVIMDCDCSQFLELVTNNTDRRTYHRQMQILFDIFDSYWDSHFVKFTRTELKVGLDGQKRVLREVDTTFGMLLKGLKWLPALEVLSTSDPAGRTISQRKETERTGADLYIPSMMVNRMLGNHVPYLHTLSDKRPQSKLCKYLEIHTELTPTLMVELLVSWSMRMALNTPRLLLTSLPHIKVVYTYLHDNLPPKELQDLFHAHPVLFVPQANVSQLHDPQTIIEGKMMTRTEVRWSESTGLFAKHANMLSDQGAGSVVKPSMVEWYRDLEELMLRSARVSPRPTLLEYCDLIVSLANSSIVQQALPDMLQLFSMIGTELESHVPSGVLDQGLPFELQQVFARLKPHAVLPTKNNRWTRLSDHPLIADDKQTERLFSKKEGVHILATDEKFMSIGNRRRGRQVCGVQYKLSHVLAFYNACGVSLMSEVLMTKYVTESFQVCPPVHRYVAAVLPFIQNVLCTDYPDIYDAHQDRGIRARLATMKFVQVARLDVVYHLKPLPDVEVVLSEVSKWKDDEDEFIFYVQKDSITATYELNKELSRYFSRGNDTAMKEIKLLLMELMPLVRDATPELQEFMRQRDIKDLPDEEEPWELPPPPVFKPPPPPPPPPQPVRPVTPDVHPEMPTGDRPEGGRTASWPPNSNPTGQSRGAGASWPPPAATMWPPPAPTSRTDSAQIPAGLRPARISQDHTGSEHGSVSGDRGSVAGDRGSMAGDRGRVLEDGSSIVEDFGSTSSHPGSISGQRGRQPGNMVNTPVGHSSTGHSGGGGGGGVGGGGHSNEHTHGGHFVRGDGHIQGDVRQARTPEPPPPGVDITEVKQMDTTTSVAETNLPGPNSVGSRDSSPIFKSPTTPGSFRPGQKRVRLESGASVGSNPDREQQLWFDVPSWSDQNVEETLEEVPCTTQLPTELNLTEGDDGELAVGRWGENLVYNYLLSQKDNPQSQVFYVKWVNEERESELPFDCEVHHYNEETQTTRRIYIEVKATRSDKKAFFPISAGEVKCAFEHEANYHLYRVFNAGNQQTVRLTKLENLCAKIENKLVRLCLVI